MAQLNAHCEKCGLGITLIRNQTAVHAACKMRKSGQAAPRYIKNEEEN